MTPLARAEAFLNARLVALERQLPVDGKDSPLWGEYVQTTLALTSVRQQLYGLPGLPPAQAPARRRPA